MDKPSFGQTWYKLHGVPLTESYQMQLKPDVIFPRSINIRVDLNPPVA